MVMKKKNIREKILKTAQRIFAQKGFFETTVDEIARSSGVAKGTIYLYFRDKSDIYLAIIENQLNHALEDLAEMNSKNLTSTEKLGKIAEEWLRHSVDFHQLFPMVAMENINQALKLMKSIKYRVFPIVFKIISAITQIIAEGIDNGEFQRIDPEVAAIGFLNIIRTPFLVNLFGSKRIQHCDEILKLYFTGLISKKERR